MAEIHILNTGLWVLESQLDVQPVGIPSYLIAIASGNLRYKPFPAIEGRDWKSGVWAEPELLEACYWEFSEDTGRSVSGLALHASQNRTRGQIPSQGRGYHRAL